MSALDLAALARVAEAASDAARREILPRFRRRRGRDQEGRQPVTEADRAAERAIRAVLREATPEIAILGEEYGAEGSGGRSWLVDPIDGTIAFSRGLPLFGTLIALRRGRRPAARPDRPPRRSASARSAGAAAACAATASRCASRSAPSSPTAIVAHGDAYGFASFGEKEAYLALARDLRMFRGYTDCFGHAQVVRGAIDAMVDLSLNPWDAAATQVLVEEAGGRCVTLRRDRDDYPLGLVFGSPPLVERLLGYLADPT